MSEDVKLEIMKGLDRELSAEAIAEALEVTVDEVNEISKDYTPCEEKNDAAGGESGGGE